MIHQCTIAGREVSIGWTVETQRRVAFRSQESGIDPNISDLANKRKAGAAMAKLLWLLLPPDEFARHGTPEDLFAAIDHEAESEAIAKAVLGVVGEMIASDEKKSTGGNSPSPESNSD